MRLETPRLVLREYTEDDSAAVLAYQSDARYLRYYPWERRTLDDAQRFVQQFIDWQAESTEAATAMADFAFRELGVRRLSSWCIAENAASARVLEKVGMSLEGRLPAAEHFKGRDWDTLLYGMIRDRWESAVVR